MVPSELFHIPLSRGCCLKGIAVWNAIIILVFTISELTPITFPSSRLITGGLFLVLSMTMCWVEQYFQNVGDLLDLDNGEGHLCMEPRFGGIGVKEVQMTPTT